MATKPPYYTINDFAQESGRTIDQLLILGRNGQIALCVELDPFNTTPRNGTITITDNEFGSLPEQPEETTPDYVIDALFPNMGEAIEKFERGLEKFQKKYPPKYESTTSPKMKRLELPLSVTKVSGKWYWKNKNTGELERQDIPPRWHNPDGYMCFLSGVYQIPMHCINRNKKTYSTNVVIPYGRPDLIIELDKFENRQSPFPVALSGSIEELVIPADELKKMDEDRTEETSIPSYGIPTKDERKAYQYHVEEFLDDGLDKVRGERKKFKDDMMKAFGISPSTEDRWFSKEKKQYYKSR